MSKVLAVRDEQSHTETQSNALDRLIPTWERVPVTKLRSDGLYLFVTPSNRVFGTYQGRQNGNVHLKTHRGDEVKSVDTATLEAYQIGGDLAIAEELNKRFGISE